ncbi:hypothetical protein ABTX34_11145 [Streptomyces sp. NPDC096538]|uniref:hypothetical protein n=1 Tax=Streptomyces sp. NPDC096538 TaxID=3155427 RepID=UPI003323CDDC
MTTTAVALLVGVLALSAGYTIGYRTRAAAARVEAAIRPPDRQPTGIEEGVVRVALAAACCEMWWTSAGLEHDRQCTRKDQAL